MWRTRIGQADLRGRDLVERSFGLFGNFACGYKGLPAWARRHRRVHRWIWAKIANYDAYLTHYHPLTKATNPGE